MTTPASSRRRTPLAAVLLVLAGLLAACPLLAAPPAHAAPVAAPARPHDPCDYAGPAGEYCEGHEHGGEEPDLSCAKHLAEGSSSAAAVFSNRRVVSERPTAGAGGIFASPPPKKTPPGKGLSHLYQNRALAGMTWHTYSPDCNGTPGAWLDTTTANLVVDATRWWTGLSLAVQREAGPDSAVHRLDGMVHTATGKVRSAIFTPWIGLSVLLLGIALIWQARARRLHQLLHAAGWALLVMVAATTIIAYPAHASRLADQAVTGTVGQIQQQIAGGGKATSPEVSQGNTLTGRLLYEQWLRGELGSTTSSAAKTYGPQLYKAQSLTWKQEKLPNLKREEVIDHKAKQFKTIAAKIKDKDADAYQHLTGEASGRLPAALTQAVAVAPPVILTIAVGAVIVCALLVIRLAVIFAPALAPLGIHERTAAVMHTLGRTLAAALIHAPLFALAGGVDILLLQALLSPSAHLPTWFAVFLAWVTTVMIWRMARPLRAMSSLVRPGHDYMAAGIGTVSAPVAGTGRLGKKLAGSYLTSRLTARQLSRYFGASRASEDADAPDAEDADEPDEPDEMTAATPGGTGPGTGGSSGGQQVAGGGRERSEADPGEDPDPGGAGPGEGDIPYADTLTGDGGTVYTLYTPTDTTTVGGQGPEDATDPSPAPGRAEATGAAGGPTTATGAPDPRFVAGTTTITDTSNTASSGPRAGSGQPPGSPYVTTDTGPSTPGDAATGDIDTITAAPPPGPGAAGDLGSQGRRPQPSARRPDPDSPVTSYTLYTPTDGYHRHTIYGSTRPPNWDESAGGPGERHSTPDEEGPE